MNFDRLPVQTSPGWDCIYGDCRSCAARAEKGLPIRRGDHGIHGDEFLFAVRTQLADERLAVLVLEVFTERFPATIPKSHWRGHERDMRPRGATLSIHVTPTNGDITQPACDWMPNKGPCRAEVAGYMRATEIYEQHGERSLDPAVDLTKQSEAFWLALEAQLVAWLPESLS